MNRKLPFLIMIIITFVSGCGGGSAPPPPPGPQPISVAFSASAMPPASLMGSGTASVAATVSNDSASGGVKWSCTPANACGTFNPTSTASGAPTTYTAPAAAPSGGSVMIIATSATDSTKSASASVHISGTASNATLKGQYAFLITAPTGNPTTRGTTTFAGSVNLDGNGNLIQNTTSPTCPVSTTTQIPCAGVEDIVSTKYFDQADPILPTATDMRSTYAVDASGHGSMTIETNQGETLSFGFVLTSASHAVIIETNGEPGSGTLDLQSGPFDVAHVSGTYAFTLEGVDTAVPPATKLSFGGVFVSNGMGSITSGTLDVNSNGTVTLGQTFTGSIFQAPDANGRGRFTASRSFTFYMVSPKVLRLFEDDNLDLMGGSAYAQGTTATLSGNFVFEHAGWSSTGRTVAAGQFAANGTSTITGGVSDSNAGGAPPTISTMAKAVSGTFALNTNQTGTLNLTDAAGTSTFNLYMVDPTLNILDPNNSSGGGGALLLHTDANINGTGILIPQVLSSPPAIVGNQALNLRNSIAAATPNEVDLVGVVTSDGSTKLNNGMADFDQDGFTTVSGAPFTGTFAADSANAGHFTGTFSIPAPTGGYTFIPPAVAMFNVSFYQASGSQALVIQTDTTANVSGYLIQQRLPSTIKRRHGAA